MGQCRNCGRSGWLLGVDENGVCGQCKPIVLMDIRQRVRIMEDSIRLAEEGKTAGTRLSRCDLVVDHARHLMQYEQKGIPTISPPPSALCAKYSARRDTIVLEEATALADKARAKAELAATPRARASALSAGLLKVNEVLAGQANPDLGQHLPEQLKHEIHGATLEGFLAEAEKAEFKGNSRKALDQYQEALFFVKRDGIPDDQQTKTIADLEDKIRRLSEK